MAHTDTNISNLKINRGTYSAIQSNLSSIEENELILITDKAVPIPDTTDSGKVVAVNSSGEYELQTLTIPTVNNATLTIQKNGTTVNTFTANASTNVTANITVPTTLDDISDGSTRKLSNYLLRSGGSDNPLTAPVYINHSDLSFIGTAGGFGFRAAALSGQSVPHLGQINLSKNFGGDGSQYGIQMSAVDITNNLFNQFRVYQAGIAYQQYNNSSGTTTNVFTVDTAGALKTLSDIYEGGTADANKLSNKYLGKTAKAADSDKLDGNDSTYYLNYNNLSNKPTIPTVNNASHIIQLNGNTIGTNFTANASSNITTNIKALPNYSLNISTSGGNPREVKFVRVNYTNFTSNYAAYFKIGAMCSHGNGSSYTFLEDIIIGVTSSGGATCTVYKQVQNTSTYTVDSHTVHFGDVYWVVDTTNKYVDFFIICGQYATINFTPFTAIGSTSKNTSEIIQQTGSATLYSSGTRVWNTLGNGSLYAKTSDIPTKTSDLTNDSGYTTTSSTLTANKILAGNDNKAIKTSELYVGSSTSYDFISTNSSILLEPGQGESIYLGEDSCANVIIGSQGNDDVKLRIYGSLASGTGSQTYSLPSSSGQLATTNDIPGYSLGYSSTTQSVEVRSNNSVTLTVPSGKVPLFLGYGINNADDISYYGIDMYDAYIYKDSSGWKAYAYIYNENGSIVDGYIDIFYVLISVDEI